MVLTMHLHYRTIIPGKNLLASAAILNCGLTCLQLIKNIQGTNITKAD